MHNAKLLHIFVVSLKLKLMEKELIYEKMAAIMKAVQPIKKDSKNEIQKFMFRGIDAVMNELHQAFAENEVFITTEIIERKETERQSKNGGMLLWVVCTCKFRLHTTDGSSVSITTIGEGMDSGDKGTNKAMSIALKYALLQAFLIPTEEQKDPDAETHEPKATLRPFPADHITRIIKALNEGDDTAKANAKAYYLKALTEYSIPKTDQETINKLLEAK